MIDLKLKETLPRKERRCSLSYPIPRSWLGFRGPARMPVLINKSQRLRAAANISKLPPPSTL